MRIMFWNLNNNSLQDEVAQIAFNHNIDIIVLAEDPESLTSRIQYLNHSVASYFSTKSACERIRIITRFSDRLVKPLRESEYYTAREFCIPACSPFILIAMHWKSLMWRKTSSQTASIMKLGDLVREIEDERGHQRSIFIGDLNVDPHDDGMLATNGFNAVMSRQVASRQNRTMNPFGEFPFFYNPMWSIYGDESEGPPGTYYRSSSEEVCQFWHIFDQVLIRPALVPYLPSPSVKVLTESGGTSFVNSNGHPKSSDHLPILLEFDAPIAQELTA